MSTVIQITNLSKIYRLGEIGTGTISRDLERWYKMNIKGQDDPFLKIGETNERDKKGISDLVYSLRNINLEVQKGEALGIIGKNGAGKSTLLKILSRVTSPTTGKINIKGRVASLLEVGTGFHPELTGLENIYINGAILGMRKKEITRKLDEIIDFSGVERYIDTPVKRYSSGMYVRLAFAVAAHLESEILIVDEVLAVGDAEFQKKCLGKMKDVSSNEGRTILFVSHNLVSIRNLCVKGVVMDNGRINYLSDINDSIKFYMTSYRKGSENATIKKFIPKITDPFSIVELQANQNENYGESFLTSIETSIKIKIKFTQSNVEEFVLGIIVYDDYDNPIFSTYYDDLGTYKQLTISKDEVEFNCSIPKNFFNEGQYFIEIDLGVAKKKRLTNKDVHNINLTFNNIDGVGTKYALGKNWRRSALLPYLTWKFF